MIIDQLPAISAPLQSTDEIPVERGQLTYKVSVGDSFVNKAGDTMTGTLLINNSAPALTLVNQDVDYTDDTREDTAQTVVSIRDKNSKILSYWQTNMNTSGRVQTTLLARRSVNGAEVTNSLSFRVAADGTKTISLSDPDAWHSALGLDTLSFKAYRINGSSTLAIPVGTSTQGFLVIAGAGATRGAVIFRSSSTGSVGWDAIGTLPSNISITAPTSTLSVTNSSSSYAVAGLFTFTA